MVQYFASLGHIPFKDPSFNILRYISNIFTSNNLVKQLNHLNMLYSI